MCVIFVPKRAHDIVEESVNRVDLDPARIEAGLESAKLRGSCRFKESQLLAGPMRQTDKPARDEGWPPDRYRYGQGARAHSFRGVRTCA